MASPLRRPRILLTHSPEARALYYGERALAALRALGDVRLHNGPTALAGDALIEAARGCDFIVSYRNSPGHAALFDNAPDLRAFLRCAVDIRNVDVAAASRNGILVTRANPGFAASVSELILGQMIDLTRGITRLATDYHQGRNPVAQVARQLSGSTLGIIGYGAIGRNLARLGKALGMAILVHDPFVPIDADDIIAASLPDLLSGSDYVVCLAVANPQTEKLMDASAFAHMKADAYFINASRGELVDEQALEQALISKRIAGAGLDVGRADDQMPPPRLARLPNVIATPHIGGLTRDAIEAQAFDTVAQLCDLINGRMPYNAVNREHAHRITITEKHITNLKGETNA